MKAVNFFFFFEIVKKLPELYRKLSSFKYYIDCNMKDFLLQLKSKNKCLNLEISGNKWPSLDD